MKKNNFPIFILISLFLITGCQDVKKGFSGKKIDQGEEFLVIKKNPLVVPPDFEKMPMPKDEIEISNSIKVESNQDNDLKKLFKTQDQNIDVSESRENTGNLEKKIIDKIKYGNRVTYPLAAIRAAIPTSSSRIPDAGM